MQILNNKCSDINSLEMELIRLVRKSIENPRALSFEDTKILDKVAKNDTLDYVHVINMYHFINRIASLLDVSSEGIPDFLKDYSIFRRFKRFIGRIILSRANLQIRSYSYSYKNVINNFSQLFELAVVKKLHSSLKQFMDQPYLLETIQSMLEEQKIRTSLDIQTMKKIHTKVEEFLPNNKDDCYEYYENHEDPVDAFVFIGTRHPYRINDEHIRALRKAGYDDMGILDLTISIADANQWARLYRLLGLDPELYYIH